MRIRRMLPFAAAALVASGLPATATAAPTAPLTAAPTAAPAAAPAAATTDVGGQPTGAGLPLGPADLPETRTTSVLAPGVTLTTIVRGRPDPADVWTVEVAIPGGSGSPDPDAPPTALADRAHADALAALLRADGFDPRVEQVSVPATADYAGGTL